MSRVFTSCTPLGSAHGTFNFGYGNASEVLLVHCVEATFAFTRLRLHSGTAVHSWPWAPRLVSTNRSRRSDGRIALRFLNGFGLNSHLLSFHYVATNLSHRFEV